MRWCRNAWSRPKSQDPSRVVPPSNCRINGLVPTYCRSESTLYLFITFISCAINHRDLVLNCIRLLQARSAIDLFLCVKFNSMRATNALLVKWCQMIYLSRDRSMLDLRQMRFENAGLYVAVFCGCTKKTILREFEF